MRAGYIGIIYRLDLTYDFNLFKTATIQKSHSRMENTHTEAQVKPKSGTADSCNYTMLRWVRVETILRENPNGNPWLN